MLRIHLMQQWQELSDPAMEDALIEAPTMRRFAGIDLFSDRTPDETEQWHLHQQRETEHLIPTVCRCSRQLLQEACAQSGTTKRALP
jgi:IS5 family transposase